MRQRGHPIGFLVVSRDNPFAFHFASIAYAARQAFQPFKAPAVSSKTIAAAFLTVFSVPLLAKAYIAMVSAALMIRRAKNDQTEQGITHVSSGHQLTATGVEYP